MSGDLFRTASNVRIQKREDHFLFTQEEGEDVLKEGSFCLHFRCAASYCSSTHDLEQLLSRKEIEILFSCPDFSLDRSVTQST
jgi:hypothetical protein